jgi:hypothetical protein
MHPQLFRLLEPPQPVTRLGCWAQVSGRFTVIAGYTAFGDFFLLDPETQQYAVLYTIGPELVPTNFRGSQAFVSEFLTDAGIVEHLGRPQDVATLEARIGPLAIDEVFIPEPYPFLGGSGELDTFAKGNVWVFADLVGQMQGIGQADEPVA